MTLMLVCGMTAVMAQKPAQIKFDKTTHNFGTFSEKVPKLCVVLSNLICAGFCAITAVMPHTSIRVIMIIFFILFIIYSL